jgi:hypothetical protein
MRRKWLAPIGCSRHPWDPRDLFLTWALVFEYFMRSLTLESMAFATIWLGFLFAPYWLWRRLWARDRQHIAFGTLKLWKVLLVLVLPVDGFSGGLYVIIALFSAYRG